MELSQLVYKEENAIEKKFERLKIVQNAFDEIVELYEENWQSWSWKGVARKYNLVK